MGIEKNELMVCESINWTNIYDDIEKHIKIAIHVLIFQHTQPKEKIIHHENPRLTMGDSWCRYVHHTQ